MTDRQRKLEELAADLKGHDDVRDAFTAKSFTDMLVIVDVAADRTVPKTVIDRLGDHNVHPVERVYGDAAAARSFVGPVGNATRHHFVDRCSRGSYQSYVVE